LIESIAVIGGTGKEGNALASRFAKAGVRVIIGSRDAARGEIAAGEMMRRLGVEHVEGTSNREAAQRADVVLLAVPYYGMPPILEDLRDAVQNKIVINIASSLDPVKKSHAKVPPAGSTTAEVQQAFGEKVRVVAAFQNISPEKLAALDEAMDTDVLVCGADKDTRAQVVGLVQKIGIEAFDAGTLANAVAVETLTAALIAVNLRYKVKGAGIRLTGIQRG
jgi:NADPH-dependent F420 reductase